MTDKKKRKSKELTEEKRIFQEQTRNLANIAKTLDWNLGVIANEDKETADVIGFIIFTEELRLEDFSVYPKTIFNTGSSSE